MASWFDHGQISPGLMYMPVCEHAMCVQTAVCADTDTYMFVCGGGGLDGWVGAHMRMCVCTGVRARMCVCVCVCE